MFLRGKKKKKRFPSAEPKAALQMQKPLLSTEQSGKGEEVGPHLPREKEDHSRQFLYNMYRARCRPVPQIVQNTQQYLKTNRNVDGPCLRPTGAWEGKLG